MESVLRKYFTFSGRARRSEFWWWMLVTAIVAVGTATIDDLLGSNISALPIGAATIIPTLAVGARRLHDVGYSGWLQLIYLVPVIGAIVLVVLWCTDGHGTNDFGENPKVLPSADEPAAWGTPPPAT